MKKEEMIIPIIAFVKGGEQRQLRIPESLLVEMIKGIWNKGYEMLHLSGGNTIETTGILIGGTKFYKEARIICVGESKEMESIK